MIAIDLSLVTYIARAAEASRYEGSNDHEGHNTLIEVDTFVILLYFFLSLESPSKVIL
jgi:hypothetical protein